MKIDLSRFWSVFEIPEPVEEYKFCEDRRWRFDYAWPDLKIAVEVEGGIWLGGRHNRPVGYQKDLEKYNRATLDGWKIFRFTPTQFRNGTTADFLEKVFNATKNP